MCGCMSRTSQRRSVILVSILIFLRGLFGVLGYFQVIFCSVCGFCVSQSNWGMGKEVEVCFVRRFSGLQCLFCIFCAV